MPIEIPESLEGVIARMDAEDAAHHRIYPERYRSNWLPDTRMADRWMNEQAAEGYKVVTYSGPHGGENFGVLVLMESKEAVYLHKDQYIEPKNAVPVDWR